MLLDPHLRQSPDPKATGMAIDESFERNHSDGEGERGSQNGVDRPQMGILEERQTRKQELREDRTGNKPGQ
jgi:hypothetical protein